MGYVRDSITAWLRNSFRPKLRPNGTSDRLAIASGDRSNRTMQPLASRSEPNHPVGVGSGEHKRKWCSVHARSSRPISPTPWKETREQACSMRARWDRSRLPFERERTSKPGRTILNAVSLEACGGRTKSRTLKVDMARATVYLGSG